MCRWTFRVLCWLALGAAANVAVALAFAWRFAGTSRTAPLATPCWPMATPASAEWPNPSVAGQWSGVGVTSETYECFLHERPPNTPGSERLLVTVDRLEEPEYVMHVDTFGWPARSIRRASAGYTSTGRLTTVEGWEVGFDVWPSHPMPIGFVANTLLYGAVLSTPVCAWCAPRTIRRWHRCRRGLCIQCAYPVADLDKPCPECGKPSTSSAPAQEKA